MKRFDNPVILNQQVNIMAEKSRAGEGNHNSQIILKRITQYIWRQPAGQQIFLKSKMYYLNLGVNMDGHIDDNDILILAKLRPQPVGSLVV